MFELDPAASHMMPAHFGPRPFSPKVTGWYHDVTSMTVSFLTEREQLAQYLPPPYTVADEAVVTITYACNRKVDWLAGHGYNLVAVSAAAEFAGQNDTLSGDYTLVMWENLTDPILTGRELQGIPKVYADISDHEIREGDWHASASHFGHQFLDLAITGLRAPSAEEIAASAAAKQGRDNPMAWRFLPGVGGFGQSESSFTTFPSENVITEAWVGEGRANWQQASWEQNPTQCHIINALAQLPVLAWRPAIVARGSTNLIMLDRLPRAIR